MSVFNNWHFFIFIDIVLIDKQVRGNNRDRDEVLIRM